MLTPEQCGISSLALLELFNGLEENVHHVHTFSLSRCGIPIVEASRKPYSLNCKMNLLSVGKSLVSMAIGILEAENRLRIDDLVLDYFRDKLPAEYDLRLEKLRIRHLLIMAASSCARSTPFVTLEPGRDWAEFYLSLPMPDEAGHSFEYDTGASYMLSRIVTILTGKSALVFLKERVFNRMGITDIEWLTDAAGVSVGGWGLYMCPHDLIKLGQLWSDYGRWDGEQLVPEDWMRRATAYQIDTSNNPGLGWRHGYGYQFWQGEYGTFLAFGGFGQLIICNPVNKLVVIVTAGCSFDETQWMGDWIHEKLFSKIAEHPLQENPEAYLALKTVLREWVLPYPEGSSTGDYTKGAYRMETNEFGICQIGIRQATDTLLAFSISVGGTPYEMLVPFRDWRSYKMDLSPAPDSDLSFSYAWKSPETLVITQCMLNSPYVRCYTIRFHEDQIRFEVSQNFSLVNSGSNTFEGQIIE